MQREDSGLESRVCLFAPDRQNVLFAVGAAAFSFAGGYALYEPSSMLDALTAYEILAPTAMLSIAGYAMGSLLRD